MNREELAWAAGFYDKHQDSSMYGLKIEKNDE